MDEYLKGALEVAESLKSPYLVEKVQNYFGVHRIVENGHGKCNGVHNNRGASVACRVDSVLWYYLFRFGSLLGYEMFYASFFPFVLWNVDPAVCRRVLTIWALVMYVGGTAKDLIRWPRPRSPPVVQFDMNYSAEYGMPSTHAMTGASVPFSLLIFTVDRYQYPVGVGFLVCVAWCALLCMSRLYLGMHTVLDLLGGLALAWGMMAVLVPPCITLDVAQLTSPWGPPLVLVGAALLCFCYPAPKEWTPARGDTCLVLSTVAGILAGEAILFQYNLLPKTLVHSPPYHLHWPSTRGLVLVLLRTVTGIAVSVAVRVALKGLVYQAVCRCQGQDPDKEATKRVPTVELPTKFLTYLSMGITMAVGSPLLFNALGIQCSSRAFDL